MFLLCSAFLLPHPEKVSRGGEDSYFISKEFNVIGVADGVGGWSDFPGADPSYWSQTLMNRSNEFAFLQSPKEILIRAASSILTEIQGSTTASIVSLNGTTIEVYIVGDSGVAVFRDGKLIARANETSFRFNFPYQIGSIGIEQASEGALTSIEVLPGDLVVLASDGLWDNIFEQEIGEILFELQQTIQDKKEFVATAAEKLAIKANKNGADLEYHSPFEAHARAKGYDFSGGKLDDVTVIVAIVEESQEKTQL
jgi:protein phosphatase PTC7